MLRTQCTQQNNLPQKSIGKLFSTTKKGYVEDRRSLFEIRRFQMPIQHCQCFGMEVTETLWMECSRHSRWPTYETGVPTTRVLWPSHIPATPRIWSTKSKHALTIPVYSPLQELCFVRTAISSSPRMERSMRGCLRLGRLQITYRLQAPRSNRANHLIPQTLLNALR